jgi:hypothetical protein
MNAPLNLRPRSTRGTGLCSFLSGQRTHTRYSFSGPRGARWEGGMPVSLMILAATLLWHFEFFL